ncbi:MAG: hypothetical protein ACOX52_15125 [Verrucomicrobiota bacterium]
MNGWLALSPSWQPDRPGLVSGVVAPPTPDLHLAPRLRVPRTPWERRRPRRLTLLPHQQAKRPLAHRPTPQPPISCKRIELALPAGDQTGTVWLPQRFACHAPPGSADVPVGSLFSPHQQAKRPLAHCPTPQPPISCKRIELALPAGDQTGTVWLPQRFACHAPPGSADVPVGSLFSPHQQAKRPLAHRPTPQPPIARKRIELALPAGDQTGTVWLPHDFGCHAPPGSADVPVGSLFSPISRPNVR